MFLSQSTRSKLFALLATMLWCSSATAELVNDDLIEISVVEQDVLVGSIIIGRWAPFVILATLSEGRVEAINEIQRGMAMKDGWIIDESEIVDDGKTLRIRVAHPDNPSPSQDIPVEERLGEGVVIRIPAGGLSFSDDAGPAPEFEYRFESAISQGLVLSARQTIAVTTGPFALATGWWWNADESGRGFFIERQGDNLFVGGYLYDDDGRATWVVMQGTLISDSEFDGSLLAFSDGQTLTGDYRAPANAPSPGSASLVFRSSSQATLVWPGGIVEIERFDFNGIDSVGGGALPEDGWWWNTAESGRGFSIEIQNGTLFMVAYLYDDSGNPIWISAQGQLIDGRFDGNWVQFSDGQSLTGPYQPPVITDESVGTVALVFTSMRTAALTLPDGRTIEIERFPF